MKYHAVFRGAAVCLGWLGAIGLTCASARAVTFDQQEVDQAKFIVVAVPLEQANRYNLLILEQLSPTRPCWQEQGNQPAQVDPLLLKFDFTDICGRSTDSNGYSLRLAGTDLALKYSLRVVQRGQELVLLAIPNQSAYGTEVEIGRTQGLGQGFLKITLDPDWRLTRRTYDGKPLGHLYLTRDQVPATGGPVARTIPASRTSRTSPPGTAIPIAVPPPLTARRAGTAIAPVAQPASPSKAIVIPVPPPTSPVTPGNQAIATVTSQRPTTRTGSTSSWSALPPGAIPIPVPPPVTRAASPSAPLTTMNQVMNQVNKVNSVQQLGGMNPLPVPSAQIPIGNVGDVTDVYTATSLAASVPAVPPPPPAPAFLVGPRYRVVVEISNASQQTQIRSLVPDAFRSSYQGRSVMQVGSFKERGEADDVIQKMQTNGFNPILEFVQ